MDKAALIARLRALQAPIPDFKAKTIVFRDHGEFKAWHKDSVRFLRLGGPHTVQEVADVEHLWFRSHSMGMGHAYTQEDVRCYMHDLDAANHAFNAAVENLELDLVPKAPEPEGKTGRGGKSSVTVHKAETVITGDQNVVNILNSLTVNDMIQKLDRKIDERVTDEDHKEGLRAQLKGLAKHPAFAPILTLGLKHVLGL